MQLGKEAINLDEINSLVCDSELPNQLKEYLITSKIIKEVLTIDAIKEIEDLYIFYHSLYYFDTSEFSAYTITSLKRTKDVKSFYYYLKKVIDTNLELKSKDESSYTLRDALFTGSEFIDNLFKDVFMDFGNSVIKIKDHNIDIDLFRTYKNLGKMELIYDLTKDSDYNQLLRAGKSILNNYVENNG